MATAMSRTDSMATKTDAVTQSFALDAAQRVLVLSYRLKMGRVHASWRSAQMVDHHSGRDRAIGQLIGEPMRGHTATFAESADFSIPMVVPRLEPEPAPSIRLGHIAILESLDHGDISPHGSSGNDVAFPSFVSRHSLTGAS